MESYGLEKVYQGEALNVLNDLVARALELRKKVDLADGKECNHNLFLEEIVDLLNCNEIRRFVDTYSDNLGIVRSLLQPHDLLSGVELSYLREIIGEYF